MSENQAVGDIANLLTDLQHLLLEYKPIAVSEAIHPIDAFFAYRILLGRLPSRDVELPLLLSLSSATTYREFITQLLNSPEYSNCLSFLPSGHMLMTETSRFRFWFDSGDREMGARMALGTIYEPHVLAALDEFVAPGMVCIDAGAHTGFITLHLADRVGSDGYIYAFEPRPKSFQLLERNLRENNYCPRVQAFPFACSSKEGILSFHEVANMYVTAGGQNDTSYAVQAVRIDNVVNRRVGLVKIDVEGHEPEVLRGMNRILEQDRPVLLTEVNGYWLGQAGSSINEFSDLFETYRYVVFDLKDCSRQFRLTDADIENTTILDIVALPAERLVL